MGHHDLVATLMNAFLIALLEFFASPPLPPVDMDLLESIQPSLADCARCYA